MADIEQTTVVTPLRKSKPGAHVGGQRDSLQVGRGNGYTSDDHVPRRGSIRVLLSQTSKALGLPFNENDTPDPVPPTSHGRAFQFQRQGTHTSLNVPQSPASIVSGSSRHDSGNCLKRCCKQYISRLIAHFVLILITGAYILMGTLLYIYIIGPEEEMFEQQRLNTPFDVNAVMEYLRQNVLTPSILGKNSTNVYVQSNLDHFQSYLRHRVKEAGIYENKRDFSVISGILHSVSVISGIGIGNPPRTLIGKAVTFPYCFFGMPLYILFLYVIGDDVGKLIALMYHQSMCCSMCRHRDKTAQARQFMAAGGSDINEGYRRIQACVPVSLMLVVIAFYVLLAVLIFGLWEGWEAVPAIYFCIMTLMTVGLIDEVPGDNPDRYSTSYVPGASNSTAHIRRSLVVVYVIVGWLLLSACFHAIAKRMALHTKKRQFKLSQQSREASLIFRHNTASNPNF